MAASLADGPFRIANFMDRVSFNKILKALVFRLGDQLFDFPFGKVVLTSYELGEIIRKLTKVLKLTIAGQGPQGFNIGVGHKRPSFRCVVEFSLCKSRRTI